MIESVNNTLKAQLDLEAHDGRTVTEVYAQIAQRFLVLTTAIWQNDHLGVRVLRSLTPTITDVPSNYSSSSCSR